ncbi:MAG: hypothetical protein SPC78_03340 [Candidatus Faecousia sp.]|nr:hypothetical protein [Clostridiales bacterium]MDY4598651.1 hypothetical protein [Candidatus Faecousia sp.]
MSKKVVVVLTVITLILALVVAGAVGFLWYRDTHVFVDGKAYSNREESMDLREETMSVEHYDQLHALLPDCTILWNVPFQNGVASSNSEELTITTLSKEDIELLAAYFPNLRKVDAAQCGDYAMLEALQQRLPEVEVIYEVTLGGKSFAPDTTELALEEGDYDLETLTRNLPHLPQVTAVTFLRTELTMEQVEQLRTDFPEVEFGYTVTILGEEYDEGTETINLSAMTSEQVSEVAQKLSMLPALEKLILTDAAGNSQLPKEDVKVLQEAVPNAVIDYSFDFFGTKLSTAEEEVHIKNVKIGDEGEAEVRAALDLLPNCKRFVLENCQISNEVMAKLRDDYRDRTKVVWRVNFGKGSTLTDAQIIRAVYDLVDANCANLVYCEDARFMDIGHNEFLKESSFISGMKSLEYVIISGSMISDLKPFANCKNLKVLEAAFCEYIYSAEGLEGCESLERLNISYTHITDLSPLDNLNLVNLCAMYEGKSRVPQEEQERFKALKPDCKMTFVGSQPYGSAWRYDDDNNPLEWYATIRKVFRYDIFPATPNHVGWYLKDELD